MMPRILNLQSAPPAPTPLPADPEAQELLAQLRDIHEPIPVHWWPPAPGWWILAALLIVLFVGLYLWWRRHRQLVRQRAYRVEASRLLRELDLTSPIALQDINVLLKRVAIVSFGRPACAELTGTRWLEFLDKTSDGNRFLSPEISNQVIHHLYSGQPVAPETASAFREYALSWVAHHDTAPRTIPTGAREVASV